MVIGSPGSGKSTFSKKLAQVTGLPLVHIDMLYWNSDGTTVERQAFLSCLEEALTRPFWIIDGNYASTMDWRMSYCDTIVFLDYPAEVCLEGIASRRGQIRSDIPWVESETNDDSEFFRYVANFAEKSKPSIMELLDKYMHKEIYTFTCREQAQRLLEDLEREGIAGSGISS